MSWIRMGDTFNGAPEWMAVHELAASRGDDRLVNELKGALLSMYAHSAQQMTDYRVSYGAAVHLIGLSRAEAVLADLVAVGLLVESGEAGAREFTLLERDSFIHLIRSDSKRLATKRRNDLNRGGLQVPVMLRDGDQCRYCGEEVVWGDKKSDVGREYDHRDIQAPTTPENYVTSCRGCNQLRHELGDRAEEELPLLDPPENPVYGPDLLKKLSRWSSLTARWCKKEGIANPLDAGGSQADPAAGRAAAPSDSGCCTSPATGASQAPGLPRGRVDSLRVESPGPASGSRPQPAGGMVDGDGAFPEPDAGQVSGETRETVPPAGGAGPANGTCPGEAPDGDAGRRVSPRDEQMVRCMSPATGASQAPGLPRGRVDSLRVESPGPASGSRPQPAGAIEIHVHTGFPEPDAGQASGEPQDRGASSVRDAGPVNVPQPARRRRRRHHRRR